MFGYVTICKGELKGKDFDTYQAFYCGVCQELKEHYGQRGRLTLTYDMTFLAVLLSGLYEMHPEREEHFCVVHPGRKHACFRNAYTRYAADMNILFAYYNLMDDWEDEKSRKSLAAARLIRKSAMRVEETYPAIAEALKAYLDGIHACEKDQVSNLDAAANLTGQVLATVFTYRQDLWKEELAALGFYLGKFIYFMDAYEDLKKDTASGAYNPFRFIGENERYEEIVKEILTTVMAQAAKAFERLPILEHVDILRNILYIGVWANYDRIQKQAAGDGAAGDGRSDQEEKESKEDD